MAANSSLSPRDRRRVLEQLTRERLSELTTRFELDVADRRSNDSHIDAIVRKRSLDFGRVLEVLLREELQGACEALGLDSGGREKTKLVERILGRAQHVPPDEAPTPAVSSEVSTPPPTDTVSAGALKSELRRFVVEVAGGYKSRDAGTQFTSRLLRCFGWPDGQAPDATMPATLSIVASGERTTRDVALFWKARSVLVEVVKHDAMLDFA